MEIATKTFPKNPRNNILSIIMRLCSHADNVVLEGEDFLLHFSSLFGCLSHYSAPIFFIFSFAEAVRTFQESHIISYFLRLVDLAPLIFNLQVLSIYFNLTLERILS